jgi:hypothetical protein
MMIIKRIIFVLVLLVLSFSIVGQKPKIRVFTTGYHGAVPIYYIVLKEFGEHKTFNYYEMGDIGRWEAKGDSAFLFAEYKITKDTVFSWDSIPDPPFWKKNTQYVFRNDSLHDCTRYEDEPFLQVIDSDTIIYPIDNTWREDFIHFHELKYRKKPFISFERAWYNRVNIAYPKQGSGVLLIMLFSSSYYFEHYFPERNESLIGRVEFGERFRHRIDNDTITLYPMYIQRFEIDGKMVIESVPDSLKEVGIPFLSKGYRLTLMGNSDYPFSKIYYRDVQLSPRKRRK